MLMEATTRADALAERVRRVEQAVMQARLVPTDDGSVERRGSFRSSHL